MWLQLLDSEGSSAVMWASNQDHGDLAAIQQEH